MITQIDLSIPTGAIFSEDRLYRYALWRVWHQNPRILLGIGLNCSTANEYRNDPTITRFMAHAYNKGFGGFFMGNLNAYISPNPKDLLKVNDPVGIETDKYLREMIALTIASDGVVCCAWGSFPEAKRRCDIVLKMVPEPYCLGVNGDGQPKHPLYLSYATKLVPFKVQE